MMRNCKIHAVRHKIWVVAETDIMENITSHTGRNQNSNLFFYQHLIPKGINFSDIRQKIWVAEIDTTVNIPSRKGRNNNSNLFSYPYLIPNGI